MLAKTVVGGVYDENIIRDRVELISIYQSYLTIKEKNDAELIIQF